MSIALRINELRKQKKLTQKEFSSIIKVDNSQFSKIERGELTPTINQIMEICSNFNVSADYLLTGKEPLLLEDDKIIAETTHTFTYKTDNAVSLPMLPIEAMAGVFMGDVQVMEYECEQYVVPMFQGADFLIPVLGDSMYPTYNNGDVIACKKLESWSFFQYGKVYVIYTSQGVIVKRIHPGKSEDTILIVSDNAAYPAFELNRREIIGVALVIGGLWLE